MIKQLDMFGKFPEREKFAEIADEERTRIAMELNEVIDTIPGSKRKPFARAEAKELDVETGEFLCKVMRVDPRDRPTAEELLGDEWLDGI